MFHRPALCHRLSFFAAICLSAASAQADDFSLWRIRKFTSSLPDSMVSGPDADPDFDGFSNVAEYAQGTNPMDASSVPFAGVRLDNGVLIAGLVRYNAASDVQIVPQVANDLGYWIDYSGSTSLVGSTILAPGFDLLEYSSNYSAFGSQSQFMRFELRQESPDLDGDGMADAWELFYGITDPDGDDDGDGISNIMEFLLGGNPNVPDAGSLGTVSGTLPEDLAGGGTFGGTQGTPATPPTGSAPPDTDGDGAPDVIDVYPNDATRKEPPYLRHYGVIDLGIYPNSAGIDPLKIAVDDSHQTSFFIGTGEIEHRTYDVFTWSEGQIKARSHFSDGPVALKGEAKRVYYPADLNPRGLVVGGMNIELESGGTTTRGFTFNQGSGLPKRFESPNEKDSYSTSWLSKVSISGLLAGNGTYFREKPNHELEFVTIPYYQRWYRSGKDGGFSFSGLDSNGRAFGQAYWAAAGAYSVWAGGALTPIGGEAADMNTSTKLVGLSDGTAVAFQGNPLYPQPWENWYLHGEFRPFFESITPLLINNGNESIFLTALKLGEGTGQISGGFGWIHLVDGPPFTVRAIPRTVGIVNFDPGKSFAIMNENQVGTLAGTSNGHPALAIPVEFQSTDINRGFDYPLTDDPPIHYTVGQAGPIVKDQDKPEWWTSVARADVSGRGLNVNNHIKLVFGSESAARLCELHVPPESESLLEILNPAAGGSLNRETMLTIRGKATAPNAPTPATVQVRTKDSTHQVVRELKVLVMPERMVRIKINFVWDNTNYGAQGGLPYYPSEFPAAVQGYLNVGEIIGYLNDVYRQACVTFVADNPGSGDLPLTGWDSVPLGQMDLDGLPLSPSDAARIVSLANMPDSALNLLIFRTINAGTDVGGFYLEELKANAVWIGATNCLTKEYFHVTCAHEIGHALGLSVRQSVHPTQGVPKRHDGPVMPKRYGPVFPLMYFQAQPSSKWLRNEEWQPGWAKAGLYEL